MALTNLYFNKWAHFGEQNLIEDLVHESIKMYGIEFTYLPKNYSEDGYDQLYSEEDRAVYTEHADIACYIVNVEGFQGEGDFISKFGLEIRDTMLLAISRRQFENELMTRFNIERPREGDLLMFPLNGKLYSISFVEHEPVFYQMGALQFYQLRVELFEYSNEEFNTGIAEIDNLQIEFSQDIYIDVQLVSEKDEPLFTEDGYRILNENEDRSDSSYDSARDYDTITSAENEYIQSESDDILDFSEADPFSEGGRF